MILLVCFDLPRYTKEDRREARKFRERLISLGFQMKQYSVYERMIRKSSTKQVIFQILKKESPDQGLVTMYALPDQVHNSQFVISGHEIKPIDSTRPQVLVI